MKKSSLLIILAGIFSVFFSCQDEFCIEPTTPEFIIRFYNKDSTNYTTKQIKLVAWVGNDTIPYVNGSSRDSIALPIDTQNTSVTFNLSILDSVPSLETLTINYKVDDIYVSKACGFKSVFKEVTLTHSNNNWLSKSEQITQEITNQNQAHVQIFH